MNILGQEMSGLQLFKYTATAVTSLGVSTIVNGAIDHVTPRDIGVVKKISVFVAGFMISNMASHAVCNHTDKKIDTMIKQSIILLKTLEGMTEAHNDAAAEA